MFNHARIPQPTCDVLSPISPLSDPLARNITDIVTNTDASTSTSTSPSPSPGEMEDGWIESEFEFGFGLEAGQPSNAPLALESHRERCETHVSITPPSSSSLPLPQPSTISQLTLDSHLHSIRSVPSNVSNRFFDKPSSLIVDLSGRAGAMGEHSPCDALVPSIVGEYAVVEHVDMDVYSDEGLDADEGKAKDDDEDDRGCKRLDWVVDEVVEEATMKARERAEGVIRNSDDSMLWFEEYGSDWIKSACTIVRTA
ncbi:hypothetical protein F5880DRAFT_1617976 [Lentinula raphanica]|nr:hypothetical protein F5880DRAFT_1617976 [Lentinula raphanica]